MHFCIYIMAEIKMKYKQWLKRWNCGISAKLALGAGPTHDLAQLVRASEWNAMHGFQSYSDQYAIAMR